jgi:hypothetical protein
MICIAKAPRPMSEPITILVKQEALDQRRRGGAGASGSWFAAGFSAGNVRVLPLKSVTLPSTTGLPSPSWVTESVLLAVSPFGLVMLRVRVTPSSLFWTVELVDEVLPSNPVRSVWTECVPVDESCVTAVVLVIVSP